MEYYCIIILKGASFLKSLPTDIICENFSHVADLLCRKKLGHRVQPGGVFFLTQGIKQSKKKSGKETN